LRGGFRRRGLCRGLFGALLFAVAAGEQRQRQQGVRPSLHARHGAGTGACAGALAGTAFWIVDCTEAVVIGW